MESLGGLLMLGVVLFGASPLHTCSQNVANISNAWIIAGGGERGGREMLTDFTGSATCPHVSRAGPVLKSRTYALLRLKRAAVHS
eukprot:742723-Pelagomonas_calceolata.AAC.9